MSEIPIKLDPKLISSSAFKDPFQVDSDELTLYNLITKINSEREGQFVKLTEQDIEKEIRAFKIDKRKDSGITTNKDNDAQVDDMEGQAGNIRSVDDTTAEKLAAAQQEQQEFFTKRHEMVEHVKAALNEASLSLDFLSLLISSVKPNVGQNSMSPHLKQHIPLQSLNSDRIYEPRNATAELKNKTTNKKAMVSWKLESLDNSLTLLGNKSAALKSALLVRDKKYFEQLLQVSTLKSQNLSNYDNNDFKLYQEVLFKINEKMAIKYGYQDSGSRYRLDRGVAVIQSDSEGRVSLQKLPGSSSNSGICNEEDSFVIVRLFDEQENLIGESSALKYRLDDLQSQVASARQRVFEDELFYQLVKEAKSLIPYGVSIVSNVCISAQLQLGSLQIVYSNSTGDNGSLEFSRKANYIVNFLRLMLCHHHKAHIMNPGAAVSPILLRPLLGHIQHQQFLKKTIEEVVLFYEKLGHRVLVNTKDNEFIYKSVGTELSGTPVTLVITKDCHVENKDSSEVFEKAARPACTKVDINFGNDTGKSNKVVLTVETSSERSYCDSMVNLKLYNDKKLGLDVNYSDLNEVRKCLEYLRSI